MSTADHVKIDDILKDIKELQDLAHRVRNIDLEVLCERNILCSINELIVEGFERIDIIREESKHEKS